MVDRPDARDQRADIGGKALLLDQHRPVRVRSRLGVGALVYFIPFGAQGIPRPWVFGAPRPSLPSSGAAIWAFWCVSGSMTAYVWLDIPAAVALTNVAFGLPKSLAIGCAIFWLWGRDAG